MKKSILLTLIALLSVVSVSAADKVEIGDLCYSLDSSTKTATVAQHISGKYFGNVAIIPSTVTYNDVIYDVTSIGDYAFSRSTSLTAVTIPNSVTSIGYRAFRGCTNLVTITIPNSVTNIGGYAFEECRSITAITIPNSVTSIEGSAFEGCTGLISLVVESGNTVFDSRDNCNAIIVTEKNTLKQGCKTTVIPNSVTSIGSSAFRGCIGLTSITIPNSVTSIGEEAFYVCKSLTSITIPNSVTSIEKDVFRACSSLTSITIPNSVTSIEMDAFRACSSLTSITIPENVNSMGDRAFYGCWRLTSVVWNAKKCDGWSDSSKAPFYSVKDSITSFVFGDGVERIPAYLCSGMSKLTSISIPNSITSIEKEAFQNCTGLTSITIGKSVTSIGWAAFSGCTGITSVVWNVKNMAEDYSSSNTPFYYYSNASSYNFDLRSQITSFTFGNEVERIPDYLCYCMSNLTSLTISNSVTSIGYHSFADCTSLTSITIPNSVTSIGQYALAGCTSLSSITLPNNITSIDGTFSGCTSLTSITLPNSVTSIGYHAFWACTGLTSITIPNSVTSVGEDAFYQCTGLTSVVWNARKCDGWNGYSNSPFYSVKDSITSFTFGDEVETIPAYLCFGMSKLTTITIPNSVTSIGNSAFYGCTGLTSITIPNSVTSIGNFAFYGCTGLTSITIPNNVTSIGSSAFYRCTGLTSVVWNAKQCAGLWSRSEYSPFYDVKENITSFTFGNEVKSIPDLLCWGMSKLTAITIPNSVTSIGDYAFYDCTGLTSVTIPNSVTSIGSSVFSGCTGLTSIIFPTNLTTIGKRALTGCTSLTSVVWNVKNMADFSSSNTPFYYDSFSSSSSNDFDISSQITSFTFGDEVETIPAYLCYGMSKLTAITIPNSVTSIGSSVFSGCTGLTSVTIPNSVTSIGEGAFSDCSSLTSMAVESSNMKYDSRNNCNAIIETATNTLTHGCKTTVIPNGVTNIGESAFQGCTGLTSITIPNSVMSIGNYAFLRCTGLMSVTIPNSVTSIGNYAFCNCTSLTSITIGNSVTSIGNYAFYGCTALTSIRVKAKTPPQCKGDYTFYNVPKDIPVYVPCDKETYQNSAGWSSFTNIIEEREYRVTIRSSANGSAKMLSYTCDNELTIQATANEHYHFRRWSDGNTDNPRTFVVSRDITLTVFFAIDQHSISATAENGRIEGAGTYNYGSTATLKAVANEHYHFTQWSDGNTDNPRRVSVVGDATYTAEFAIDQHNIGTTAQNGRVEGAGTYNYGSTATLKAVANEHYHFTQWSDGNTDNPRIISVNGDATYTAVFAPNQYSISVSAENGYVEGAGEYDYGTSATLTAIANEHYHFERWSDGNTTNPRQVSVEGNATYTAVFAPNKYTISATAENGRVEGMGEYDYATTATLTAVADEHYHFTQWSDGSTDNPRQVSVEGNATYTAVFAPNKYTISATAENGRVEGMGEYDYATTATLTAVADEHYHFTQWSDGNTDNPRTVVVEGDATYTAEFAIDQFNITATCDIQYGEVTGDGVYDYGTRITLTAIPNSGYEFKQWSNGLTYNPYRFTVVSDLTLEAEFIPATAIDDIQADTDTTPQKVFIDGQVYILRNGKTYTLTGVEVK